MKGKSRLTRHLNTALLMLLTSTLSACTQSESFSVPGLFGPDQWIRSYSQNIQGAPLSVDDAIVVTIDLLPPNEDGKIVSASEKHIAVGDYLKITASAGTQPYQFVVKSGGQFIEKIESTGPNFILKGLQAGEAEVWILDANIGKARANATAGSVKIVVHPPLKVDPQGYTPIETKKFVRDDSNHSLLFNTSGGVPPYSFSVNSLENVSLTLEPAGTGSLKPKGLSDANQELVVQIMDSLQHRLTESFTLVAPLKANPSILYLVLGPNGATDVKITGGSGKYTCSPGPNSEALQISGPVTDGASVTRCTVQSQTLGDFSLKIEDTILGNSILIPAYVKDRLLGFVSPNYEFEKVTGIVSPNGKIELVYVGDPHPAFTATIGLNLDGIPAADQFPTSEVVLPVTTIPIPAHAGGTQKITVNLSLLHPQDPGPTHSYFNIKLISTSLNGLTLPPLGQVTKVDVANTHKYNLAVTPSSLTIDEGNSKLLSLVVQNAGAQAVPALKFNFEFVSSNSAYNLADIAPFPTNGSVPVGTYPNYEVTSPGGPDFGVQIPFPENTRIESHRNGIIRISSADGQSRFIVNGAYQNSAEIPITLLNNDKYTIGLVDAGTPDGNVFLTESLGASAAKKIAIHMSPTPGNGNSPIRFSLNYIALNSGAYPDYLKYQNFKNKFSILSPAQIANSATPSQLTDYTGKWGPFELRGNNGEFQFGGACTTDYNPTTFACPTTGTNTNGDRVIQISMEVDPLDQGKVNFNGYFAALKLMIVDPLNIRIPTANPNVDRKATRFAPGQVNANYGVIVGGVGNITATLDYGNNVTRVIPNLRKGDAIIDPLISTKSAQDLGFPAQTWATPVKITLEDEESGPVVVWDPNPPVAPSADKLYKITYSSTSSPTYDQGYWVVHPVQNAQLIDSLSVGGPGAIRATHLNNFMNSIYPATIPNMTVAPLPNDGMAWWEWGIIGPHYYPIKTNSEFANWFESPASISSPVTMAPLINQNTQLAFDQTNSTYSNKIDGVACRGTHKTRGNPSGFLGCLEYRPWGTNLGPSSTPTLDAAQIRFPLGTPNGSQPGPLPGQTTPSILANLDLDCQFPSTNQSNSCSNVKNDTIWSNPVTTQVGDAYERWSTWTGVSASRSLSSFYSPIQFGTPKIGSTLTNHKLIIYGVSDNPGGLSNITVELDFSMAHHYYNYSAALRKYKGLLTGGATIHPDGVRLPFSDGTQKLNCPNVQIENVSNALSPSPLNTQITCDLPFLLGINYYPIIVKVLQNGTVLAQSSIQDETFETLGSSSKNYILGGRPGPRQPIQTSNPAFIAALNPLYLNWAHNPLSQSLEVSPCAKSADSSKLVCWGPNHFGQLGNASIEVAPNSISASPLEVQFPLTPGSYTIIDYQVGYRAACAIVRVTGSPKNQVYCWGDNTWGQAGQTPGPSTLYVRTPQLVSLVPSTENPIRLGMARTYGCALDDVGHIDCWGIANFPANAPTGKLLTASNNRLSGNQLFKSFSVNGATMAGVSEPTPGNFKYFMWGKIPNGFCELQPGISTPMIVETANSPTADITNCLVYDHGRNTGIDVNLGTLGSLNIREINLGQGEDYDSNPDVMGTIFYTSAAGDIYYQKGSGDGAFYSNSSTHFNGYFWFNLQGPLPSNPINTQAFLPNRIYHFTGNLSGVTPNPKRSLAAAGAPRRDLLSNFEGLVLNYVDPSGRVVIRDPLRRKIANGPFGVAELIPSLAGEAFYSYESHFGYGLLTTQNTSSPGTFYRYVLGGYASLRSERTASTIPDSYVFKWLYNQWSHGNSAGMLGLGNTVSIGVPPMSSQCALQTKTGCRVADLPPGF